MHLVFMVFTLVVSIFYFLISKPISVCVGCMYLYGKRIDHALVK